MTEAGGITDLLAEIFRDNPAEVTFERASRACVDALPVSSAAISVMTGTTAWQTLGASDPTASALEELQFTLGAGPCREAYGIGGPVLVSDLTDPGSSSAWPTFASRAEDLGVRAVFAFPLSLGAIRLGVLALYRDRPGWFDKQATSDALLVADMLCLALLGRVVRVGRAQRNGDGNGDGDGDGAGRPFASLWDDRVALGRAEVHQATGMVMDRLGVSSEEALARLRGFAFSHGLLLTEVAAGVVARRIALDHDGSAGARSPGSESGES